jgi:hypothetical protein
LKYLLHIIVVMIYLSMRFGIDCDASTAVAPRLIPEKPPATHCSDC